MKHLLIQMIFARNGDTPKWLEFLPIILIAVFYAVGSILKARANKTEKQQQDQGLKRPIRKPVFRPAEGRGAAPAQAQRRPSQPAQRQPRPQIRPPRREPALAQYPAERFGPKKEPIGPGTLESIEASKLPRPTPQIEELPEFTSKAVKGLEERPLVSKEIPRTEASLEYLLDIDDPESLRRAILHYEILGRPLSIRKPTEYI